LWWLPAGCSEVDEVKEVQDVKDSEENAAAHF
jgi:hypothetical protein